MLGVENALLHTLDRPLYSIINSNWTCQHKSSLSQNTLMYVVCDAVRTPQNDFTKPYKLQLAGRSMRAIRVKRK